jgi:predicted ATPase
LCARRPVLFIFEDAHWSDPTSLELLAAIIEEVQDIRVLVLITFRPEFNAPWTGYTHITALTLNRFSRGRVAALIDKVTSGKPLPDEVRDQIIDKTDGVPLFVEELTKTVLESGLVEDRDDHYALAGPLPPLAIPSTLQDSLMARLDRLGEVKETAQIAAVIGREFNYSLLARVSTLPEAELDAALAQLTDAALVFSKGTLPRARFVFKHAMVQEAAYESLLKSKRRLLHASVADVLESESVEAEPELLAHHFSEARRYESAAMYWLRAGKRALKRSANVEAVMHLRKGLDLMPQLPESANVDLYELEMQLALGPALMAIKGYSAPEIEPVYARARELCRQVGQPFQLFAATWGLWLYYQQGGQLKQARELTEEVLAVAEQQDDPALLLQAHHAAWATFHRLGELLVCRHHAEQGVMLYDVEQHGAHAYLYGGHDPGVCAQTHAGIVLWCLGYPDQALKRTLEGLNLSEKLSHPFTHADALFGAVRIYLFRQEFQPALARSEEMIALSSQHGFTLLQALGTVMRGSALTGEARACDAINEMRLGLATTRETGAQAHVPYMMSLLIDAHRQAGRVNDGLDTVADALRLVEKTGERNWEAEILRLKGELLLVEAMVDQAAAENCFNDSLGLARTQNARSLELRAAMSLVRLWCIQGKHKEARDLLHPIYDLFTEGFNTADLKQAKALLEELK